MKPIPKNLLIHSGTIAAITKDDGWGPIEISPSINLSNVRIEPTKKIVRNKRNEEVQIASTLFYDCVFSRPSNQVFTEDTIIVINGVSHEIVLIDELYDNLKLHHYEIGLS